MLLKAVLVLVGLLPLLLPPRASRTVAWLSELAPLETVSPARTTSYTASPSSVLGGKYLNVMEKYFPSSELTSRRLACAGVHCIWQCPAASWPRWRTAACRGRGRGRGRGRARPPACRSDTRGRCLRHRCSSPRSVQTCHQIRSCYKYFTQQIFFCCI